MATVSIASAVGQVPVAGQYLDAEHKFMVVDANPSLERDIKFGWHFDDEFPVDGRTTYHTVWVGKNAPIKARCTLIVLESDVHSPLFLAYHQAKFGTQPNANKSPVDLNKIKLWEFNQDLVKLKVLSNDQDTDEDMATNSADDKDNTPLEHKWRNLLPASYVANLWNSCPDRFTVVKVLAENDDLYFWRTKMIHAVTKWHGQLVQTKVYIGVKAKQVDAQVSTSAGNYKAGARKWEAKHAPEQVSEAQIQGYLTQARSAQPFMTARQLLVLQQHGLVCFSGVTSTVKKQLFHRAILDYTRRLVGLPDQINLNDFRQAPLLTSATVREDLKVPNDKVRRNGDNTRSTHFSKSCGISGYGFHSNAVQAISRLCMPYIDLVNGYPCQVRAIDFAIQAPVVEKKPKAKPKAKAVKRSLLASFNEAEEPTLKKLRQSTAFP